MVRRFDHSKQINDNIETPLKPSSTDTEIPFPHPYTKTHGAQEPLVFPYSQSQHTLLIQLYH